MYRVLLTRFSFIIVSLVVIAAFITAKTYTQLGVAILLYPLLAFFAYKIFQNKIWSHPQPLVKMVEEVQDIKREGFGISDIDKRVFLKLIGGAGIVLFLFSIFNKKPDSLFFKNFPGLATSEKPNKIDPDQNQVVEGYRISEIDDDVISFYGFINKDGNWYVMRVDTDAGSFRYAKGKSNFHGNWSNRKNLKYDYFSSVFKL